MKRIKGSVSPQTVVSEFTHYYNSYRYLLVSLSYIPLSPDECWLERPDVIKTFGQYSLTYDAFAFQSVAKKGRFRFGALDPFTHDFKKQLGRFKSYDDMMEKAKSNELLRWLIDNSDISPETFDMARKFKNSAIPFAFDLGKYVSHCNGETCLITQDEIEAALANRRSKIESREIAKKMRMRRFGEVDPEA